MATEERRLITIAVDSEGTSDIQIDPGFHAWQVKGLGLELLDMAWEMEDEENGDE